MLKEVWIDEYLMEQVLSNLLSNAIKHTTTSGRIEISLEENNFKDYFYLRVLDNGLGISPIDIEHIFDPFYQGQAAGMDPGSVWPTSNRSSSCIMARSQPAANWAMVRSSPCACLSEIPIINRRRS
jgi:Signal transduction histidine kinase